jgi:hypothetical protein
VIPCVRVAALLASFLVTGSALAFGPPSEAGDDAPPGTGAPRGEPKGDGSKPRSPSASKAGSAKAAPSKPDETRADDAKAGDAKVDDAKFDDAKVDDAKAGDAKVDDAKVDDAKVDDAKAGTAKADDAKADAGKAEDPHASEPDPRVRPVEPGEGHPVPPARDERTGHVYVRGGTALVLPAGSIRSEVPTNALVGPGLGFVAGLGVGISRHAEIDLLGTYALMQAAGGEGNGRCKGCKGDHASLSLGLVYHLAQGIALDPWMRFGTGYRTARYEGSSPQLTYFVPGRFHGWDIAQISMGATFYPVSSFGLGPFFEADMGTYLNRPSLAGNPGGPRAYAFFQLGLRLEIDPARWVTSAKAPAKRTARSSPPGF